MYSINEWPDFLFTCSLFYGIIARVLIRAVNLVALKIEGARVSFSGRETSEASRLTRACIHGLWQTSAHLPWASRSERSLEDLYRLQIEDFGSEMDGFAHRNLIRYSLQIGYFTGNAACRDGPRIGWSRARYDLQPARGNVAQLTCA